MKKTKVAIAIDPSLLQVVDSYVDQNHISSRSQAFEFLLRQAIKERIVDDAVILMHPDYAALLTSEVAGMPLLFHHIQLLSDAGVRRVFLITRKVPELVSLLDKIRSVDIVFIEQDLGLGTAAALALVKHKITGTFVLLNGDTLNLFSLQRMLAKHIRVGKIATMGLIISDAATYCDTVRLDGDLIVGLQRGETVGVINAGVYVLSPLFLTYLTSGVTSLESDIFPQLALDHELAGFFTYGTYRHCGK